MSLAQSRILELEDELDEVYATLADKDSQIRRLKNENRKLHDNIDREYNQSASFQDPRTMNDRKNNFRDEVFIAREENTSLRSQLKEKEEENKDILVDQKQYLAQLHSQQQALKGYRNTIVDITNAAEISQKELKNGVALQYQLELENKRQHDQIQQLLTNERKLIVEIKTISAEFQDIEQSYEQRVETCKNLKNEIDEKSIRLLNLENKKKDLEQTLKQKTEEMRLSKETQLRKIDEKSKEIESLHTQLDSETGKNIELKNILQSLRVDDSRKLIHGLKSRLLYEREKIEATKQDNKQLEHDLSLAYQALNKVKDQKDQKDQNFPRARVKDQKIDETIQITLNEAIQRELEINTRYKALEKQMNEVNFELNQTKARNLVYEKENGLEESVKLNKKLEADIRRRDQDMKELSLKIGVEMDRNNLLSKAYKIIQEKTGFHDDFFEEEVVRAELLQEETSLKILNVELSRQVYVLENDRLRLLRQLRKNANHAGKNEYSLNGSRDKCLLKGPDYTINLKKGTTQISFDDQGKKLIDEINTLKAEKEASKIMIARLRTEITSIEKCSYAKSGFDLVKFEQLMKSIQEERRESDEDKKAIDRQRHKENAVDEEVQCILLDGISNQIGSNKKKRQSSVELFECRKIKEVSVQCSLDEITALDSSNNSDYRCQIESQLIESITQLEESTSEMKMKEKNQVLLENEIICLNNHIIIMYVQHFESINLLRNQVEELRKKIDESNKYIDKFRISKYLVCVSKYTQTFHKNDEDEIPDLRAALSYIQELLIQDKSESEGSSQNNIINNLNSMETQKESISETDKDVFNETKTILNFAQNTIQELKMIVLEKDKVIDRFQKKMMEKNTNNRNILELSYEADKSESNSLDQIRISRKHVSSYIDISSFQEKIDIVEASIQEKESKIIQLEDLLKESEYQQQQLKIQYENNLMEIDKMKIEAHNETVEQNSISSESSPRKQVTCTENNFKDCNTSGASKFTREKKLLENRFNKMKTKYSNIRADIMSIEQKNKAAKVEKNELTRSIHILRRKESAAQNNVVRLEGELTRMKKSIIETTKLRAELNKKVKVATMNLKQMKDDTGNNEVRDLRDRLSDLGKHLKKQTEKAQEISKHNIQLRASLANKRTKVNEKLDKREKNIKRSIKESYNRNMKSYQNIAWHKASQTLDSSVKSAHKIHLKTKCIQTYSKYHHVEEIIGELAIKQEMVEHLEFKIKCLEEYVRTNVDKKLILHESKESQCNINLSDQCHKSKEESLFREELAVSICEKKCLSKKLKQLVDSTKVMEKQLKAEANRYKDEKECLLKRLKSLGHK